LQAELVNFSENVFLDLHQNMIIINNCPYYTPQDFSTNPRTQIATTAAVNGILSYTKKAAIPKYHVAELVNFSENVFLDLHQNMIIIFT
jgi:predicted ester cyclase